MAREFDLSVAIFAPAWTKEIVPGLAAKNSDIFWNTLSPYLYVHGVRNVYEKFIISGGGRFTNAKNSVNLYPLTMPMKHHSEIRRILLQVLQASS